MATLRQELRSIQTRRPIFSYQDSSFLVTFLLIQGQMKKLDRAQIIYALVWKRKKSETVAFKDPISSAGHFEEITALMLINKLDVFAMRETWRNHTWREPKLAIDGNTTPYVIELTPKGEEQRFTRRTRLYVYVDGYSSLYRKRNAEFVSREKKQQQQHTEGSKIIIHFILLYSKLNSRVIIIMVSTRCFFGYWGQSYNLEYPVYECDERAHTTCHS